MSKAKRLLASLLVVIMAFSMMTFCAFAAGEKVFAEEYVAPEVAEGVAAPKSSAVIITSAAKNREPGTKITAKWDDEMWEFTVGVNAFTMEDFDMAVTQADVLADGGMPQILLAPGNYQDLDVNQSMQVFGYHWNTNPNLVTANISTPWGLNPEWNSDVTIIHDVNILASALGTIDIYGIEISHRFYDCWRKISPIKTVLTLRNVNLKQTDTTTAIKANDATGRVGIMSKYAMTFWNENSHNSTAATAQYNKDETYLVNFRLSKANMVAGDNRIIDEKVSPVFVIDGFCADYAANEKVQTFWMKWMDGYTRTRCEVKNSYFTKYGTAIKSGSFDYEGFFNNKDTDVNAGEWAEITFTNNIFYNNSSATDSQLWIYQTEYDKVTINNNIFATSDGGTHFVKWVTSGGGDLSEAVEIKDNIFLGFPSLSVNIGGTGTEIDMTGSYIQSAYSADYKSQRSSILPTGNVKYDYCYLDGAKTISTAVIQDFDIEDATIDYDEKTIALSAEQGFYYKTPIVSGLIEWEIYESDAEFSNIDDFSNSTQLKRCVLKETTNHFLFVVYSLDKSNYEVYKMTVTRPAPDVEGLAVDGFASDVDFTIDGAVITAQLSKDDESVAFKPIVDEGVTYRLNTAGATVPQKADGSYLIENLVKGVATEYRLEIKKDAAAEYYTLIIKRPYNTECEILSLGNNVVADGGNYKTAYSEGTKDLVFDITVSEGAWAYVKSGTSIYTDKNGKITVPGIKVGAYEFGVVAEDGITSNVYRLSVEKVKSNDCTLLGIKGATKAEDGYAVSVVDKFVVNADVAAGATYKVYADAELTSEITDKTVVAAAGDVVTAYVVVTAEDGVSVSQPVALKVSKLNVKFEVKNATKNEGIWIVELDENVKDYKFEAVTENCKYELYAEPSLKIKADANIKLDSAIVALYVKVIYPDNTSAVEAVSVVSARTAVKYADADKIPGWSKKYLDLINENGLGLIMGDEKGNFNAANGMTRYEIAAIATRLLGVDASQFKDVKLPYVDTIAPWAQNYVKAVTQLGIMTGSKNADGKLEFGGQGTTTRAQLAKIIVDVSFIANGVDMTSAEYYKKNQKEVDAAYAAYNFADDAEVANWAKPYVRLAVFAEYFRGSKVNGKNYINSNDNILRQEIVVVMCEYLGLE